MVLIPRYSWNYVLRTTPSPKPEPEEHPPRDLDWPGTRFPFPRIEHLEEEIRPALPKSPTLGEPDNVEPEVEDTSSRASANTTPAALELPTRPSNSNSTPGPLQMVPLDLEIQLTTQALPNLRLLSKNPTRPKPHNRRTPPPENGHSFRVLFVPLV